jgi:hypothetical protein
MSRSPTPAPESGEDFFSLVGRAAPPAFTIPVLAFKAFIPDLAGVFILGCFLAVGLFFTSEKVGVVGWARKTSLLLSCFAWLAIIDEVGANEIFNKFILENSVDDHASVIRFSAGFIVCLNLIFFTVLPARNSTDREATVATPTGL